jgi:hypothetical protein
MIRARHLAQVVLGLLLSAAGMADDASSPEARIESPPEYLPLAKLLAESAYAPRWQLNQPLTQPLVVNAPQRPISNLEFRDASSLERVTSIRTLSLLTLSSSKQSRLFFGLNEDGLLGLHLRAVSRANDDEYLELAQMFNSGNTEPDAVDGQSPPE